MMETNSTMQFAAVHGRVLKDLMNDDSHPGLLYILIFFIFLFALMLYLLGCFGRPIVPS